MTDTPLNSIYEWQQRPWEQLTNQMEINRLHHAILLHGQTGIGKHHFAYTFAKKLLCQTSVHSELACNECQSCKQFSAQTHPDFHLIEPAETGKPIKIDQIRALSEKFILSTHYINGRRIAFIKHADRLNQAASNALLKTLEEPSDNSILILCADTIQRLPATILSRCQKIQLAPPSKSQAKEWLINNLADKEFNPELLLAITHNQPITALSCDAEQLEKRRMTLDSLYNISMSQQTATQATSALLKIELSQTIQWVYGWIGDLIRLKLRQANSLMNIDYASKLEELVPKVELTALFRYIDSINDNLKRLSAPLNQQLQLEQLLMMWQTMTEPKKSL